MFRYFTTLSMKGLIHSMPLVSSPPWNIRISGHRKGPVAWNGLIKDKLVEQIMLFLWQKSYGKQYTNSFCENSATLNFIDVMHWNFWSSFVDVLYKTFEINYNYN